MKRLIYIINNSNCDPLQDLLNFINRFIGIAIGRWGVHLVLLTAEDTEHLTIEALEDGLTNPGILGRSALHQCTMILEVTYGGIKIMHLELHHGRVPFGLLSEPRNLVEHHPCV